MATEPRYRALLVGNSTFEADTTKLLLSLNGPRNDVRLLSAALVDPSMGLHAAVDVDELLDRDKGEVELKMEEFFVEARRDDQLLFYYSGHGWPGRSGGLYLCVRNTNVERLGATAVSKDFLNHVIDVSPAKAVVIVLDCCHSGAFKGVVTPEALDAEGRFVITSARAGEVAPDAADPTEPSPFTRLLVQALRAAGDEDGDGFVTTDEVYRYLYQRAKENALPLPMRNTQWALDDLKLARRPATPGRTEEEPALALVRDLVLEARAAAERGLAHAAASHLERASAQAEAMPEGKARTEALRLVEGQRALALVRDLVLEARAAAERGLAHAAANHLARAVAQAEAIPEGDARTDALVVVAGERERQRAEQEAREDAEREAERALERVRELVQTARVAAERGIAEAAASHLAGALTQAEAMPEGEARTDALDLVARERERQQAEQAEREKRVREQRRARREAIRRLAVPLVGLLGGVIAIVGAALPWIEIQPVQEGRRAEIEADAGFVDVLRLWIALTSGVATLAFAVLTRSSRRAVLWAAISTSAIAGVLSFVAFDETKALDESDSRWDSSIRFLELGPHVAVAGGTLLLAAGAVTALLLARAWVGGATSSGRADRTPSG